MSQAIAMMTIANRTYSSKRQRALGAGESVVVAVASSLLNGAIGMLLSVTPFVAIAGPAESSVWIDVTREDGVRFNGHPLPRQGEGMGVAIPSGQIATAAHVVWGAKTINVTDGKGTRISARVACTDGKLDVAVLRVDEPLENFATIRAKPAVTGERVGAVQHRGSNGTPDIAPGIIGATRWTTHGSPVPLIFSGIKGEKGMSGGGLFDRKGELVGIIVRVDSTLGYLSALPVGDVLTRFSRCRESVP
jgi:serine protease Do